MGNLDSSSKSSSMAVDLVDTSQDENILKISKQLTIEEKQKIKQMIEETPGGDQNEDEEQDNYLDNLENDDSD